MPFTVTGSPDGYTVALCAKKAWSILARCDCGHEKLWRVADQAGLPPGLTLAQFSARLAACPRCGGSDGVIDLRQDTGAAAARDRARFEADVAAGRKKFTGDFGRT